MLCNSYSSEIIQRFALNISTRRHKIIAGCC